MKKDSLISENIGKALLLFVLPLIAGSLIQQLYTTDSLPEKSDLQQLTLCIHFLSFRLTL